MQDSDLSFGQDESNNTDESVEHVCSVLCAANLSIAHHVLPFRCISRSVFVREDASNSIEPVVSYMAGEVPPSKA